MRQRVKDALADPVIAKAVAFLMYRLGDEEYTVDENHALSIVEALRTLLSGEDIPESLFPIKKLSHLDFEFSDYVRRRYDPVDGFVEI